MPGATTVPVSGGVRTRQKTLAVAATGQPSSSADSQHTVCDLAVHAAATPRSRDSTRGTMEVSDNKSIEQAGDHEDQPPFMPHKQQQAAPLQPVTTRPRTRAQSVSGLEHTTEQQMQQQEHCFQGEQVSDQVNSQRASYRTRAPTAAVSAAHDRAELKTLHALSMQQGSCKLAMPAAAAAGAAGTSAGAAVQLGNSTDPPSTGKRGSRVQDVDSSQQSVGQQQQEIRSQRQQRPQHVLQQAAVSPTVMTRRRSRLSDCSNNAKLQTPATAANTRGQQVAGTSGEMPAAACDDEDGLAVLHQATTAAAALAAAAPDDCSMKQQAAETGSPSEHAAATATAAGDDTIANIPRSSLRARFARLTADQQLSILVALEQLTELEDARRARLAARLAAAAAKEARREAVRGKERRSGRHVQLLEGSGEGVSSRTSTPDPNCAGTPEPAAAAQCNNGLPEAMLQLLQATAAAHGSRGSGRAAADNNNRAVDAAAGSPPGAAAAVAVAVGSSRKRAGMAIKAEPPATESRELRSRKRAKACEGRLAPRDSSSTPEPAVADDSADPDLNIPHHQEEVDDDQVETCTRPVIVKRLGVRAQARKRVGRRACTVSVV